MGTAIEELIRNVLATKFEAFNDEVIEDAKRLLMSLVAQCAVPRPFLTPLAIRNY